jgi:hypothetical protein
MDGRRRLIAAGLVALALSRAGTAQVRPLDEGDREAFRAWFTFLADAQFYRPTPDVADCAGLVRHAAREALKAHTPEWRRLAALPGDAPFADVRRRPAGTAGGWLLFRVGPGQYAEFADARTIVALNARRTSRDTASLRPGDLLYFRQDGQVSPDHLMVFIGSSRFDPSARDWVVYHTGPLDNGGGEVRKVRLADLGRHPAARWRPVAHNPAFVGVFRLDWL